MSGFSGHKRGVRREVITSSGDDWRNAPEEPDVPKDKPTMDAINLALHGNYVFASLPEEDVETVVRKMHCVTVRARARARVASAAREITLRVHIGTTPKGCCAGRRWTRR